MTQPKQKHDGWCVVHPDGMLMSISFSNVFLYSKERWLELFGQDWDYWKHAGYRLAKVRIEEVE